MLSSVGFSLLALLGASGTVEQLPFGEVMCSRDGWCVQFPNPVEVVQLAAHEDTLVVASSSGVLALWHDGAWQPRGLDTELGRVDALGVMPGSGGGMDIAACAGSRCVRGSYEHGVFAVAPAARESVRALVAAKPRVRRAPLDPRTPLQCEGGVALVGRPDAPFVACRMQHATSLHRSQGGVLTTLAMPWMATHDAAPAVTFDGGGCAPCFFGERGLLWSGRSGWRWLSRDLATPRLGRDGEGYFIGRFGVEADRPVLRNGSGTSRFDGTAWSNAQTSVATELGTHVKLKTSALPAWAKAEGRPAPIACRETRTPLLHAFVRGDELVLHGAGVKRSERLPVSLDSCELLETSAGLLLGDGSGRVLLRKSWEAVADGFAVDPAASKQRLAVRAGTPVELLEVRMAPHLRAPRVTELSAGDACVVVSGAARRTGASTFRPVLTPSGQRGWVSDRALSAGTPGECGI